MKKIAALSFVCVIALSALSACSNSGSSPKGDVGGKNNSVTSKANLDELTNKTIELTFFLQSMTEDEFNKEVVPLVKKKFPNYKLTGIVPGPGKNITDLIAAGQTPDILVGSKGAISAFIPYGTFGDISDLIKKFNYDMSRFEPALINIMKSNFQGQIIGLPYRSNVYALQYNKDLFDKFGVSYPKDGMNWDEVYDMAKRMTRVQDGTVYRGYSERWQNILLENNQLSLGLLDTKQEKSALLTDDFKNLATFILRFYQLPGLSFDMKTSDPEVDKTMFEKGLSAMQINQNSDKLNFNWDLVSVPTMKEKPGTSLQANGVYWLLTKQSTHRDEGFMVMSYLASDEIQKEIAQTGRPPVVKNTDIQKSFMANNPIYKGKNIGAYFYLKQYAPEPPERDPSLLQGYSNAASQVVKTELMNVMIGSKDLNTALRDADEKIRMEIATRKADQAVKK